MRVALALAAFALLPATASAELTLEDTERKTDRLSALTFSTPSLNFPADVRVLLPDGYARHPRRRDPVLYLLHGSFDTAASWAEKGDAEAITAGKPLIVVMPDTAGTGDAGGWASDWANEGNGGPPKFETFTIRSTQLERLAHPRPVGPCGQPRGDDARHPHRQTASRDPSTRAGSRPTRSRPPATR